MTRLFEMTPSKRVAIAVLFYTSNFNSTKINLHISLNRAFADLFSENSATKAEINKFDIAIFRTPSNLQVILLFCRT